ncbi:hypothetical protein WMY93_000064 [Mugilogobius chulae]|uniref:Alkylated DNA repair protein AlkB homologue 8 N-terminal domain-containing protein n=1 Tax=Mugilogobius chulae TaxID=88201 RepID=A0AAW0PZW7_9GOBI
MHQTQLNINGSTVERVPTYKYLGVNIAEDMKWDQHISSVVKKSRQRLYHLRKLRQFNISVELRRTFYCSTVESVLSGCLTVWYGNATERDKKALRRVVRCAERITGTTLLYPEELYKKSCVRRAQQIMADIHHPHHDLFQWRDKREREGGGVEKERGERERREKRGEGKREREGEERERERAEDRGEERERE